MKKYLAILLVTCLFGRSALAADCPIPVIHLLPGQTTNCEGYLFSLTKEKEVRQQVQGYKLLQEEDTLKDQQLDLYKQQLADVKTSLDDSRKENTYWKQLADDSTKQYAELRQREGVRDWIFLVSGVLLTVAAGYSLNKASK